MFPDPKRQNAGAGLSEFVIVVALLALLVGGLTPDLPARLEAARSQKAAKEGEHLGKALLRFREELGLWPDQDDSGTEGANWVLLSGTAMPTSNPCGSSFFWSWVSSGHGDLLAHHLWENRPGYGSEAPALSSEPWETLPQWFQDWMLFWYGSDWWVHYDGTWQIWADLFGLEHDETPEPSERNRTPNHWSGPYAEPFSLDPWGRPYLVNIRAGHSTDVTEQRRIWVLSAGPDGIFQTDSRARVADRAQGDDIGYLVYLR